MLLIKVGFMGKTEIGFEGSGEDIVVDACCAINTLYNQLDDEDAKALEKAFIESHSMIFSHEPKKHLFDDAKINELMIRAGELINELEEVLNEFKHKRN